PSPTNLDNDGNYQCMCQIGSCGNSLFLKESVITVTKVDEGFERVLLTRRKFPIRLIGYMALLPTGFSNRTNSRSEAIALVNSPRRLIVPVWFCTLATVAWLQFH